MKWQLSLQQESLPPTHKMFYGTLFALSFLWRLPLRVYPQSERDFQKGIPFFPLAGFLEGLFLFLTTQLLFSRISEVLLSIVLVVVLLHIRGIFHLDGLGDTFDALSYRGNLDPKEDKEKRLAIMKDSTIGVAGVLAISLAIIGKVSLFNEILKKGAFYVFILPYFFSRLFLVYWLYRGKPAKEEGLGYLMISLTNLKIFTYAMIVSAFLLGIFLMLTKFDMRDLFWILISNAVILWYFKRYCEKRFSGLTGDNLGALVILSELITLSYLGVLWQKP
ncbi:MAG: adenosylcobinamide-GDP ribazoletransferase [Caldimicrobium sp.]|nr:adenosylcobinamide-GDP ribazoletransferase [Caldimicrobium sp.]MCX7872917.1 adenosylcobinamide-GDP ribazoletransferase [Caldimicrobium sp.]MDW8094482.1 adenosylcobinamide-GDP ribazoletransferase [Caldimicrobium sp.]